MRCYRTPASWCSGASGKRGRTTSRRSGTFSTGGTTTPDIDGEHDLFGDGRVVCIPTYGHTPGHQSLRVRLDTQEIVLTADACYLRRTLEEMLLPTVAHDREAMLASLRQLRRLQERGARIFYGHDPEFWATVPQAPAEVR
jgi:glyoxylase-like metal-dependent hydrolase (beta-lactamase superfamily II)